VICSNFFKIIKLRKLVVILPFFFLFIHLSERSPLTNSWLSSKLKLINGWNSSMLWWSHGRSDLLAVFVRDWKLVSLQVLDINVHFLFPKENGPLSEVRVCFVANQVVDRFEKLFSCFGQIDLIDFFLNVAT